MRMRRNERHGPGNAPAHDLVAPLRRPIRIDRIQDGFEDRVTLTLAERAEIAALQDLPALDSLTFDYRLQSVPGGSVRLQGRLRAAYTQTCVVSLAPIAASLELPVDAEFWPLSAIERWQAETDRDVLAEPATDWPEPICDNAIDLGPLIYESFATALDPYPRAEGAQFEWPDTAPRDNPDAPAGEGPFAVLKRLRKP
jgi:Large ribosomal RNA subunit accumulation protein YceD